MISERRLVGLDLVELLLLLLLLLSLRLRLLVQLLWNSLLMHQLVLLRR